MKEEGSTPNSNPVIEKVEEDIQQSTDEGDSDLNLKENVGIEEEIHRYDNGGESCQGVKDSIESTEILPLTNEEDKSCEQYSAGEENRLKVEVEGCEYISMKPQLGMSERLQYETRRWLGKKLRKQESRANLNKREEKHERRRKILSERRKRKQRRPKWLFTPRKQWKWRRKRKPQPPWVRPLTRTSPAVTWWTESAVTWGTESAVTSIEMGGYRSGKPYPREASRKEKIFGPHQFWKFKSILGLNFNKNGPLNDDAGHAIRCRVISDKKFGYGPVLIKRKVEPNLHVGHHRRDTFRLHFQKSIQLTWLEGVYRWIKRERTYGLLSSVTITAQQRGNRKSQWECWIQLDNMEIPSDFLVIKVKGEEDGQPEVKQEWHNFFYKGEQDESELDAAKQWGWSQPWLEREVQSNFVIEQLNLKAVRRAGRVRRFTERVTERVDI